MALKGNKGDWSEIYTFLYVLTNGKLDVADENLNAIPGEFYKILEILRKESDSANRYIREDDNIHIYVTNDSNGQTIEFTATIADFAEHSKILFKHLKEKKGRSFECPDIEEFLTKLKIYSIKDVGHKRDITIKIEDFHCGLQQTLGFSIKSLVGQDSTLFNPGSGTNFIYEIQLKPNIDLDIESFNQKTYQNNKISLRLNKLINDYAAKIVFHKIQSSTFQQNLTMIDGDLPRILAELLLIRYIKGTNQINTCISYIKEENPLKFNLEQGQPFYEYKTKKFLQDCALGMTAETVWNGIYDATGGQIIVKDTGDVVCYHIYEQNRFLDFLLRSCYFEQASTGEDEHHPGHPKVNGKKYYYSWVYKEEEKYYIKLNLQVRMKKN